ncbi:MAG: DUF4054 domain-containing protein, partial [Sphingomonadaceae bacterium]|nr:DUF4054 domain-containing protein [Sphingomonadaceae bacterium]
MSGVVPTPGELIDTFPAFAAVDQWRIQFWIDRAARVVDTTWAPDDFTFATMLHAAHEMVVNGFGAGAEAEAAAGGASGFRSLRSGALALERFDAGDAARGYGATQYGRQFLPLLAR